MEQKDLNMLFDEFREEVMNFSKDPSKRGNLYDFEKSFRDLTNKYERKIFEAAIGEAPKSKNKKKP
jgi:hypothetical protein